MPLCLAQYTITDKTDVYIGSAAPDLPTEDQLWLDTGITPNQMKRYVNGAWKPIGNRTFVSANAPDNAQAGDLWINSSEGNKLYRYDGASWLGYQDQSIPALHRSVENLILAISGGSAIFRQPAAPAAGMGHGDLWFDTDDNNKCHRYGSGGWTVLNFTNTVDTIERVADSIMTADEIVTTVRSSAVYVADLAGKADAGQLDGLASEEYVSEKLSTEIVQRNDAIRIKVEEEKARAQNVEGQIMQFVGAAQTYFVFDLDGLNISKPGSPFSTLMGAEKLSFLQDGVEVAYIQYNKLFITIAQITDTLTIGNATAGYTDIVTKDGGLSAAWRNE